MDLRFLRDMDRREVDFVVLEEGKHLFAVECKAGEKNINPALYYFRERTELPGFYQVHEGKRDFEKTGSGFYLSRPSAKNSTSLNLVAG